MDRAKHLLHAGLDRKARRGGVRSACRRDDTRELSHGNILVPTFQRSTSDRGTWPCTSLSILLPTSSKGGGQCGPLFFPPHTHPHNGYEKVVIKKKKELHAEACDATVLSVLIWCWWSSSMRPNFATLPFFNKINEPCRRRRRHRHLLLLAFSPCTHRPRARTLTT